MKEYHWTDGWPVWYTAWGSGFPKTDPTAPRCVSQRKMSDFGDFEWIESDCKTPKASICMIRTHKVRTYAKMIDMLVVKRTPFEQCQDLTVE